RGEGSCNSLLLGQPELAPRDDHGAAADLDSLELAGRAVGPGVQRGRAADLNALRDLDLLAEADSAVTGEVDGQRPRGRAGGRVLHDSGARSEHSRLPTAAGPREAVHADEAARNVQQRVEVRAKGSHLVLGPEPDVDEPRSVLVDLDRQLRARDAERGEQRLL